jgi:glutaconate CoA-transferase, subunit B
VVLTPLGCFDFHPDSRAMRIESLHPGVTLETARAQTGFEQIGDSRPRVTRPPDDEELETLRLSVDSERALGKWN